MTVTAGLTSSLPGLVPPTLDDVSVVSAKVEETTNGDEVTYAVAMTLEIVVNVALSDEESTRRRRSLLASETGRTLAQSDANEVRTYDLQPASVWVSDACPSIFCRPLACSQTVGQTRDVVLIQSDKHCSVSGW